MTDPLKLDYRDLPAIPESENVELPERIRQTLMRRASYCPRSAYLYLKYGGGAPSHDLLRGSAIHEALERTLAEMMVLDEPQIPEDLAKRIAEEVISEYPLKPKDADAVRLMAWHWAQATVIDPSEVAAFETTFLLELDGTTVSCKPDRVLRRQVEGFGTVFEIDDYKSSFHQKEVDELTTERSDGTKAWVEFQGVLYTLAVVFGIPEGGFEPLGRGAAQINVSQVYPRYLYDDPGSGLFLGRRSGTIRPIELVDWRDYMTGKVRQMKEAARTGKWQAIKGGHCTECPCPVECPLPEQLRDHAGTIETMEQAVEAAELVAAIEDSQTKPLKKELKSFASLPQNGPIRFGADQVWEFNAVDKRNTDRDGLIAAAREAAETGKPFDENDYISRSQYNEFRRRRLKPAELKAEQEAE